MLVDSVESLPKSKRREGNVVGVPKTAFLETSNDAVRTKDVAAFAGKASLPVLAKIAAASRSDNVRNIPPESLPPLIA